MVKRGLFEIYRKATFWNIPIHVLEISAKLQNAEMAIWKSRHWHLGISIGIDVGIGIGIAKKLFCLAKSLFLPFEVLYEENIHGDYFSSTLAELPGSFSRCLEQLFCRKPIGRCILRKELHSRRYLRSFKNTQGLKPHFASL